MTKKSQLLLGITILALVAGYFVWNASVAKAPPVEVVPTPVPIEEEVSPVLSDTPFTPFPSDTFHYIEVTDSCGPYYGGNPCVNLHTGPGTEFPKSTRLRNGIVLRTSGSITKEGHVWYKIMFDEWLRYPERVKDDLYIAGDYVSEFSNGGPEELPAGAPKVKDKIVIVSLKQEKLWAYENDVLFMETPIASGVDSAPTEPGVFNVYRKTPSRYMQGPVPGTTDDAYDLPGVPWNMYFTTDGGAIHGTYWHNQFKRKASHGCINMPIEKAKELYQWGEIGMRVVVIE